ncbi:hypothetical protein, partial [uncultured Mycolicibacterium sp.]|uniref:hypothetical protein n=1 Tax=uncultured Mycolicibacterium sp. TaxID=2320817 RepID=UPI0032B28D38
MNADLVTPASTPEGAGYQCRARGRGERAARYGCGGVSPGRRARSRGHGDLMTHAIRPVDFDDLKTMTYE